MQQLPAETKQIFMLLYQERQNLPQDLFGQNGMLLNDFSNAVHELIPFVQREMVSFINAPLKDIVLYGPAIAPTYLLSSEISIAFVLNTNLPDEILEYVRRAFSNRGFDFQFHKHIIRFYILKTNELFFPNWSLLNHSWNKKPIYQKFPFTFEAFEKSFYKLYKDCEEKLDNLPKTRTGVYTLESCRKIEKYFSLLKSKSLNARKQNEQSLTYHLWRALNVFHIPAYFDAEINKAIENEAENGTI